MRQADLPSITDKQLDTLLYLYKFRFINTNQFQKLFNHKNPTRIQQWLKDLTKKEYVTYRDFDRTKFINNTKPAIYSLTKLARMKLKTHPKCETTVLDRVYQEDEVSDAFVSRYIFLTDLYLTLQSQMGKDEKLHFSTQANLVGFDYFPKPKPDAYIAMKTLKKTKRYFLFFLDPKTPRFVLDRRIQNYCHYADDNAWADYSSDPLPSFLIICPHERTKNHLKKIINNEMSDGKFYLTTKEKMQTLGFQGGVWKKVT